MIVNNFKMYINIHIDTTLKWIHWEQGVSLKKSEFYFNYVSLVTRSAGYFIHS